MKSIIQPNEECYFCGCPWVEMHHVRIGAISRKRCNELGLLVWLCREHHTEVHKNGKLKLELQRVAQEKLEEKIGHEKYMELIRKGYI